MCQITLLDTTDTKLSHLIKNLVILDEAGFSTNGKNDDGFGFMLFDDYKVVKTRENSYSFIEKHYRNVSPERNLSGLYHVRLASTKYKTSTSRYVNGVHTIESSSSNNSYKTSHPFETTDLVVVHNGTLTLKSASSYTGGLFDDTQFMASISKLTDSNQFTHVLQKLIDNDNNTSDFTDLIADARRYFTGSSVFIIYYKVTETFFILKDDARPLNLKYIYKDGVQIGVVLNSGLFELNYWSTFISSAFDNITFTTRYLPVNNIFSYKKDSHTVYQITETPLVLNTLPINVTAKVNTTKAYNVTHYNDRHSRGSNVSVQTSISYGPDKVYKRIATIATKLKLTLDDINIISLLFCESHLYNLTNEDFEFMLLFLDEIDSDFTYQEFESYKKLWLKLPYEKRNIEFIENNNLYFPYFFNSKKKLRRAINRLINRSSK